MVVFHSYVSLPEGNQPDSQFAVFKWRVSQYSQGCAMAGSGSNGRNVGPPEPRHQEPGDFARPRHNVMGWEITSKQKSFFSSPDISILYIIEIEICIYIYKLLLLICQQWWGSMKFQHFFVLSGQPRPAPGRTHVWLWLPWLRPESATCGNGPVRKAGLEKKYV